MRVVLRTFGLRIVDRAFGAASRRRRSENANEEHVVEELGSAIFILAVSDCWMIGGDVARRFVADEVAGEAGRVDVSRIGNVELDETVLD